MRFYLLLLFLSLSQFSFAQWQQTNGPEGGQMNCLALKGNFLFTGAMESGLFRSDTISNVWNTKESGLTFPKITTLFSRGNVIYAGTLGWGIFLSLDNGETWKSLNNGLPAFSKISGITATNNAVFCSTLNSGVFVLDTIDSKWINRSSGLLTRKVGVLYATPKALFAGFAGYDELSGITQRTLSISIDNGLSWKNITSGLPQDYTANSVIQIGDKLLAGTFGGISIFKDTSWVPLNNQLGNMVSLVNNAQGLFALIKDSLYMSHDTAKSWTKQALPLKSNFTQLFTFNNALFALSYNGIFKSTNNGKSWIATNKNLNASNVRDLFVAGPSLVSIIDKANPYLWPNYEAPDLFLTDDGTNWHEKREFSSHTQFATLGNNIIALVPNNGFYISKNYGIDWILQESSLSKSLDYLYVKDSTVFIYNSSKMLASIDKGITWTDQTTLIGSSKPLLIVGSIIYAGISDFQGGLIITKLGGSQSYTPQEFNGLPVQVLLSKDSMVFAGTTNGLYVSLDKGLTWQFETGLGNRNIKALITSNNYLLAGTYDGFFFSKDNGISWFQSNSGLPFPHFLSLAVKDNMVYAGIRNEGVWKRNFSELVVGLNETIVQEIEYFPNPSGGDFMIKNNSATSLTITDILNQPIYEKSHLEPFSSFNVDISTKPKGIYFFNIQGTKTKSFQKIIVQ
jgi:hypothetical protein